MSRPVQQAYVVVPLPADHTQTTGPHITQIASAIHKSLYEKRISDARIQEEQQNGPLKEIVDHKDSLYRFISWENPLATFGLYVVSLGALAGAHYLPLTQFILKGLATVLGLVSVTEFASRSFGKDNFTSRVRPKRYKKINEPTLNATLKDVHDVIQYLVVKTQRVVLGQDLQHTFTAFLSATALYWLIAFLTPFQLAVLGLTTIFAIPLVTSPRGREVVQIAQERAGELGNAAVETSKTLAEEGQAKAAEISSRAQTAAVDAKDRLGDVAQSGSEVAANLSHQARDTAIQSKENVEKLAQNGAQTVSNASQQTRDTVYDASRQAKDTVSSASGQVGNAVSGAAQSTAHTASKLPEIGADAANNANRNARAAAQGASDYVKDSAHATNEYVKDSARSANNGTRDLARGANDGAQNATRGAKGHISDDNGSVAGEAANQAYRLYDGAADTAKQALPRASQGSGSGHASSGSRSHAVGASERTPRQTPDGAVPIVATEVLVAPGLDDQARLNASAARVAERYGAVTDGLPTHVVPGQATRDAGSKRRQGY